jgi:hypothetical protein
MSLDGVGNWKAGNSVGNGSAKGDSRISLGCQTAIKQAMFKGIFNGILLLSLMWKKVYKQARDFWLNFHS